MIMDHMHTLELQEKKQKEEKIAQTQPSYLFMGTAAIMSVPTRVVLAVAVVVAVVVALLTKRQLLNLR